MTRKKCVGPTLTDESFTCPFESISAPNGIPAYMSECEYYSKGVHCEHYGEVLQERRRRESIPKKKSFFQRFGL